MAKNLTSTKARKILGDKKIKGHALTARQKRFFGAIAGGQRPRRQGTKSRKT